VRRPPATDAGLAAVVAAAIALELALRGTDAPTAAAVPLTLAIAVPLAWRRAAPLAAAAAVAAAILGWAAAADDVAPNTLFVAPLLAFFHLGAHPERRRALQGTLLIAALAVATPAVDETGLGDALFVAVLLGAPWLGGRVVRRHRDAAQRLAAVAEELRRERDEHERLAVLAERTRIAAELNDAVAHALAEILMQAGAASNAIANDPETATAALRAVQERGRAAARELRRMLVLMRASPSRETPASSTATPEGTTTRTSPNTAIAMSPSSPPSTSA
jgi:signal transduction histidine kinase